MARHDRKTGRDAAVTKFQIILTRDVTESAVLEIEASSQEEAEEMAMSKPDLDLSWSRDDNAPADRYVTACDEAEPEGPEVSP